MDHVSWGNLKLPDQQRPCLQDRGEGEYASEMAIFQLPRQICKRTVPNVDVVYS